MSIEKNYFMRKGENKAMRTVVTEKREQRRQMHNSRSMGWIVGVLMAGMMLFASVSEAAIAIDATSSGTGTTSPITVSHPTGSGTNRLMLVGISGARSSGTVAVSGVTYGGVALSLVGTQAYAAYQKIWIYQLVAPATGTADVVVTFSTAPNGGAVVGVVTFTGVNQSTPLGTFVSAQGTSTTPSVNVSSATGELVFDTVNHYWPLTVGANQTQRWNTGSGNIYGAGSTESGAATVTMSWTASGSDTWAIGAVPIKPVGLFEYRRQITVDRTKIRNPATFPIAWDSVSSAKTADGGAGSLTWSHTTGSGNNRILIVGVSIRNGGGQTVTGVTYNGLGLTLIGSANNAGNVVAYMYYRLAPPTGTYSIIVTLSASAAFVAGAVSLFNVDPTTPLGTFASATGSGHNLDAAQLSVPSASGEIVVATLAKQYNYAVQPEQSAQQADRWNLSTTNGTSADILGVGTLRGGEATARAYWGLTGAPTQQWAIAGVPVKPTTAAPPQITTLSNYPLLVSLSDTTLRDIAHAGHVQSNSNGYDIIFRAFDATTCGGTAPCTLDHEIEKYDGVNGQVVAWVRLPSVNGAGATSDTQIYMYYGNSSISSPTQNKAAVWDANYMEVWHLAESSPAMRSTRTMATSGTITNEADVTRAAREDRRGLPLRRLLVHRDQRWPIQCRQRAVHHRESGSTSKADPQPGSASQPRTAT